jgi:hypothetical protein
MFVDLLNKFGFGIAVIAVVGWFLAYKVWPFYEKQVQANAEQRERILKQFDESLARRDKVNQEIVNAIQELSNEMRARRNK